MEKYRGILKQKMVSQDEELESTKALFMEDEFMKSEGDPEGNIRRLDLIGERIKNIELNFNILSHSSELLEFNIDHFIDRKNEVRKSFNEL